MIADLRAGLRVAILFNLFMPIVVPQAFAEPAPVRLDDIGRGTLLFRGAEGESYARAPEVKTVVEIDVAGPVARTVVRQLFDNPGERWMEGVYVFPLPEGAAVDGLKLRIGERLIEGRIDERAQARQRYETARREGRKAALLEAERPNIFTTSVANIGPGETVAVEIRYQERLRLKDGAFRLRFPMVVGPRYVPAPVKVARFAADGWALPGDLVPDAERITPPVRHPEDGAVNPLKLTVRLRPGFPLADVSSHHHAVDIANETAGLRTITLAHGPVPADRDFELTWTPAAATAPTAGLFYEDTEEARYVLAMLIPPSGNAVQQVRLARELIFILDVSGSMAGQSILQAKAALARALGTLSPEDRFNVIAFSSDYRMLHPAAIAASPAALAQARRWIGGLEANGGTEMAPALAAAMSAGSEPDLLRQIVFLTDGAVGNEDALFRLIRSRLGDSRLFTVGIGSAPNSHFMRGAARAGRGSFVHIGNQAQVAARIDGLAAQLERPALTGIAVAFAGDEGKAELAPSPIPDLYDGEPVVFAARLPAGAGEAVLSGRLGVQDWRAALPLSGGQPAIGIAKLWARERIAQLEVDRLLTEDKAGIDAAMLQLALNHGLVTRLTSLVAVDAAPSRPADAALQQQQVATNLPAGWAFEKVFGPATPARKASADRSRQAALLPRPAAQGFKTETTLALQFRIGTSVSLPGTATPAIQHLLIGIALLLIALCLALWGHRLFREPAR